MFGNIQLAFYEGSVDNQLRVFVRKAGPLPGLDLLPHRLDAVYADCEDVDEAQVPGVFC